jgi:hypothetical protein
MGGKLWQVSALLKMGEVMALREGSLVSVGEVEVLGEGWP